MNARDTTKGIYIVWRLDTGCGPTLYKKCHSHNTPGKRHNITLESNPSRGTVLPESTCISDRYVTYVARRRLSHGENSKYFKTSKQYLDAIAKFYFNVF